jgi:hypothetical protein
MPLPLLQRPVGPLSSPSSSQQPAAAAAHPQQARGGLQSCCGAAARHYGLVARGERKVDVAEVQHARHNAQDWKGGRGGREVKL